MPAPQEPKQRAIRSFVIRSGRMTESQKKAFDTHMARWSLPFGETAGHYDFNSIYANSNPVTLEIGFGMGDSLAEMARTNPAENFLGIEVHQAGVGRLLRMAEELQLNNLRVVCHDAVAVLKHNIAPASLQRVNIFFPDPWHKKKHNKRRLIQDEFLTLLHSRMTQAGLLHFATDWPPYAEHTAECVQLNQCFKPLQENNPYVDATEFGRPETKFERRGLKLGHRVCDMVFTA